MNGELHDFCGVWLLDEEASDFGPHPAPGVAERALLADAERVVFWSRWRGRDGKARAGQYSCTLGGPAVEVGGGVQMQACWRAGGIETRATRGQQLVHTATRMLSDSGDAMTVRERAQPSEGANVETLSVYRRCRVKQVLLYRRDLKMRKGKIAAQCAHASLAVFQRHDVGDAMQWMVTLDGPMAWWLRRGSAKVVLSVADESALLRAHQAASAMALPNSIITDAGRTEFHGVPTRTAVAIGPAPVPLVDEITGPAGLVETKLA